MMMKASRDKPDEHPRSLPEVIKILRDVLPFLASRFKVKELGIVGSYARDEQAPGSDIDILVDFSEPIGWEVVDLQEYLEKILSTRVDLILKGGVLTRPRLFEALSKDIIHVTA
jgi:uncharacterized protein